MGADPRSLGRHRAVRCVFHNAGRCLRGARLLIPSCRWSVSARLGRRKARRHRQGKGTVAGGYCRLEDVGSRLRPEVGKYLLADILALSGQRDEALAGSTRYWSSRAPLEPVGWMPSCFERRANSSCICAGNDAQAELEFRHAIDIARSQSAKLFELRAATCLARLWSDQGRRATAQELLRPIYAWFSDGPEIPGCAGGAFVACGAGCDASVSLTSAWPEV